MQESFATPEFFWVFGYGSLMWDGWEDSFGCERRTVATLPGYQRTFNKPSVVRWGTKVAPCPTLNVQEDTSASCVGMAFAFDPAKRDAILAALRKREGRGFEIKPHTVHLADGAETQAFTPVYLGDDVLDGLDVGERARMVGAARGTGGTGIEYVRGIADQLKALGIDDPAVRDLWAALTAPKDDT